MKYDLKIYTENIEPEAINQIYNLILQPPFLGCKVRIMPDVHYGTGCVVGFTSTFGDKIIPDVLGVDLGCGMLTAELGKAEVDFSALDDFIKSKIPYGSAVRKESNGEQLIKSLRCYGQLRDKDRLFGSIGSLGGGNHFIEIDADGDGNKYLVIHSGSRNVGLQVAKIYQAAAVYACKNCAEEERRKAIAALKGTPEKIPAAIEEVNRKYAARTKIPAGFCYLDGAEMQDYMHDLAVCQRIASENRKKICADILRFLKIYKYTAFETVHNFIDADGIIRKGAIPAREGQKLIIPMNMRDGCILGVGKGNADWNNSAPHGAGRLLKRSVAKDMFSVKDFEETMKGVYTTTATAATIDEAPFAYKPMEEIVGLIGPTVEIQKIIRPVYNFKAGNAE